MSTSVIQDERNSKLNDRSEADGSWVLYWMQQSQRAEHNHALEYAIRRANQLGKPLVVVFVLTPNFPDANARHFRFLLEGLQETTAAVEKRGIAMTLRIGEPVPTVTRLAQDAAIVVCDRGYLRHQKQWRSEIAKQCSCEVVQVESDVVVPVHLASDHREYAARTIRPKLQKWHDEYLVDLRTTAVEHSADAIDLPGESLSDIESLLSRLPCDDSVPPVEDLFQGGTSQAKSILKNFLANGLNQYDDHRNQPETGNVSHMSKYLHFGQISPVAVALTIQQSDAGTHADRQSFLEELLTRRELAQNFAEFTEDYDSYSCLPDWAKETLEDHRDDPREHHYTRQQLEDSQTHDPYWNAAMRQMRHTGYMHNYMRMYWGKKILQWTNTPEYAFRVALEMNNKYFLDGRDANSFANVAWLFGNHDRAFTEREVFGKVRYMSEGGLQRKADADAYVEKVDALINAD